MPDLSACDLAGLLARYRGADSPGHAIGIYHDGELVRHACLGLAVVEHNVPISADTVFDIASASKQFTAACMLLLQRDGALRLDDDVREHVPELRLPVPVTVRQCLSHTAGIREYLSLCELAGVPTACLDEARVTRLIAGQAGLNFPPGTSWSYSNSGFALCAVVLRRVTGMSLAEFAADRVFRPLGMHVTRFRDDLGVLVDRIATGYTRGEGGWRRVDLLEEVVGDGALVTSISDLAGWQRFMLTGAVLGADMRDAMLTPSLLADGRKLPYGLGLEITTAADGVIYLHSGHIGGFRSVLAYLLSEGIGIAVLANRDDTSPAAIAMTIAGQVTGLASPRPAGRLGLAAAQAAQPTVCGLWYAPALGTHVVVSPNDDGTVMQEDGDWTFRFAALADGTWRGADLDDSARLRLEGDRLIADFVVGDEEPEVYVRAHSTGGFERWGSFFSQELAAYASIRPGADGQAVLTVGLSAPRALVPGHAGTWTGCGLTVAAADDANAIEITLYGAGKCQFRRVSGEPPARQRGM